MEDLVDLHIQGGLPFMVIMTILFIVNFLMFIYALTAIILKNRVHKNFLEAIKQIGGFAAAWGAWSSIAGLFFAVNAIEASTEIIPFQVISGGMKVALLTVLYGIFIFSVSMAAYILLKIISNNQSFTVR